MGKLICGDVGYGKTEIAIRAAFKAVQENKQVAYLAPTTILAQQIYNTFSQRMKDFPVRVDLLCRFRTAAQQKKTISDLKKDRWILLWEHTGFCQKMCSLKILGFLSWTRNNGLVWLTKKNQTVKDQCGCADTYCHTDSADTSHEPDRNPGYERFRGTADDRVPIQTYVMEYNEELIREAITRELARGGQVYYVYNKVRDIDEVTSRIQELVPEANVAFAHGQMRENQLEDIMYRFINGDIDVLVSTTIIETGLDISNVNTMIIHDADNMGLSQLYQLRGRVGRSNRTAYAFLMYRRNKMLKEVAEKRLAAIREYSDLGSGFKIAM